MTLMGFCTRWYVNPVVRYAAGRLSATEPGGKPALLLLLWWRIECLSHFHHEQVEDVGCSGA